MRPSTCAIAAFPLILAAPTLAQIVPAGSAKLGSVSTRSITRVATVSTASAGAGTAAARTSPLPSVGLSPGGTTGASGRLGRPPQALGTTPTLSERIDGAAGVASPRIGARVGALGDSTLASDSSRFQSGSGASSALDTAGRPTGTPFAPDPVRKTVPGALDHDDDPLTPQ